jgi:hypothetical protein
VIIVKEKLEGPSFLYFRDFGGIFYGLRMQLPPECNMHNYDGIAWCKHGVIGFSVNSVKIS